MSKFNKRRQLLEDVRCTECGVPMIERTGSKGAFYGCGRFPLCVGTRPKGGDEPDSYTKLLRTAWSKALLTLSSPKYMGFADARPWLVRETMEAELTDDEVADFTLDLAPNEYVERGIDAACAWASEKAGEEIDFLVNAHEERYAAIRGRLRFVVSAEQIHAMPKLQILRRYDMSDLSQLEADIAQGWKQNGLSCPRCGAWSEPKNVKPVVSTFDPKRPMTMEEMEELFNEEKTRVTVERWECGVCGDFERTQETEGAKVLSVHFAFMNDKNDPELVAGSSVRKPRRRGNQQD